MDNYLDMFFESVQAVLEPADVQKLMGAKTPVEKCDLFEQMLRSNVLDDEWIAICQSFLGNSYAGGFDDQLRYDKARVLLRQAIESGLLESDMHVICQCNLAGLYAAGLGGEQLSTQAYGLLKQAFDSGHLDPYMRDEYEPLLKQLESKQS